MSLFDIYNEKMVILDKKVSQQTIDKLLNMVKTEDMRSIRHDVLESLSFAGLVYG